MAQRMSRTSRNNPLDRLERPIFPKTACFSYSETADANLADRRWGPVSGPGEPSPQSRQISAIKKGGCPRAHRWVCITSRQITDSSITRNEVNAKLIGAGIQHA